jgi:hypothetical protein
MMLARLSGALLLAASLAACASQTPGAASSNERKIDFQRLSSTNLDCSSIKPYEWGWVTPRTGCVEYERH